MIKLVKLDTKHRKQLEEMLDEWISFNRENPDSDKSPYAIFKNDFHNFDDYISKLEIIEPRDGLVPDSTFFLYDEERDIFIGATNIRHYLNEGLLKTGGHIGDGIRPSERRKGYGKMLVKLALDECKKLGINAVLMTCNKDNIGSAKTIISNGGVLENEVIDENGSLIQRYWIDLEN